MSKIFQRVLFIFRRDLRLEDNLGLLFALEKGVEVIPCFIFTPEQITDNPHLSPPCLQFMIESLEDLGAALKKKGASLFLFFDHPEKVVVSLIQKLGVDAVVVNRDYTPYSETRDAKIEKVCNKAGVSFHLFDDALLHAPEETLKDDGTPYTVFTPFYKKASQLEVPLPLPNKYRNYYLHSLSGSESEALYKKILPKRQSLFKGGREAALKILKTLSTFSDYSTVRDFPAENGTTHLSPHLKFTTCSPREVYHALKNQDLIRSLYWRDFFTSIAFHFPHVFKGAFRQKYDDIVWKNDRRFFKKWCEGQTGFPIVDAGMRELNATGYMQNRVRMIAGSFLVKDLHIDWRWGEAYFREKLIDYDPAVNNGNWQWVASTGCDAQPYFRIFNPWTQQKKFDEECVYIKKWIPELSEVSSKDIHNWDKEPGSLYSNYPAPLIDHSVESKIAIASFKTLG